MASNNNSQKFNSKFGGVSAKKSSSVDTDQLVKLKENNHMEWEKILDLYFKEATMRCVRSLIW